MADWSSEKTEFIEEYRKYTVLWRSVDKNYEIREERRSALQELGVIFNVAPRILKFPGISHTNKCTNCI